MGIYKVVIGSKPDTFLPDVLPERVFAVNGAAPRALYYREKYGVQITSVLPQGILNDAPGVRARILSTKPDELMVRCTFKRFKDEVGFLKNFDPARIRLISSSEQFMVQKTIVGAKLYLGILKFRRKGFKKKTLFFLERMLLSTILPTKPAQGCSTGMWAVLYNLFTDKSAKVVMCGIGLEEGCHFYDDTLVFSPNGAKIDAWIAVRMPEEYKGRLYTTDRSANRNGGIQLWEGRTVCV